MTAHALADRLEQGPARLTTFASALTTWSGKPVSPGGPRSASSCITSPASTAEIQLAQTLAGGKPVMGVTLDAVNEMNAGHATENDAVTKAGGAGSAPGQTARQPRLQSGLSATRSSLRPLRVALTLMLHHGQFVLEDHAVRHSYHH